MGSNNISAGNLQKGFNMADNLFNMFSNSKTGTSVDLSGDFEEQATMMDLDARERAMEEKRAARKQARAIRDEQEKGRSQRTAEWGRSGLAMSGSHKLVSEARRTESKEAEDDVLFQGDMHADRIMAKGMRDSNLFRINNGQAPKRTTLSLGSKLYDNLR